MLSRIKTVVLLLLVSFIIIAVLVQNLERTSFQLYPGFEAELISGVLVLIAFALGAFLSFLFLIAFGVRAYFREKALEGAARRKQQFIDSFVKAKALSFTGPTNQAISAWRKLGSQDPSKMLCRLELAKLLARDGDKKAALAELDAIRSDAITHPEVLFLAAQLNRELGNSTAALDNLALLLAETKSREIAALARDLSRDLGRFEDALEYHERLREIDFLDLREDTEHADLLVLKAAKDEQDEPENLKKTLKKLSKAFPTSTSPLLALASLELQKENVEEASTLLQELGKRERVAAPWLQAMNIQRSAGQTEKAKSIGRIGLRELAGSARFEVEILLVALEFEDGKLEDSRKLADNLHGFVVASQNDLTTGQLLRFVLLYAQILATTETDAPKSMRDLITLAARGLHSPHAEMSSLNGEALSTSALGEQELQPGLSPIFSTP